MPKNRKHNDTYIFNLDFYDSEINKILNCISATIEMMNLGEYKTSYYLKSNYYKDIADLRLLRDSILSNCNNQKYNKGNSIIYKDWLSQIEPKYFWLNSKIKNKSDVKKITHFLDFFNRSIDKQKIR